MSRRPTLRARLTMTYVGIVAAVTVAGSVTIALLTPSIFERRIQQGAGRGVGAGRSNDFATVPTEIHEAWRGALTIGLLVAAAIGLALALVLAVWLSRRMLRHLTDMQVATQRIAAGDYRHSVSLASEAELADLGVSINELGYRLAETDRARAQLVSDLAHELRNPLATIEGYMEGLIDGVLPATTETFSTVAAEAGRLGRLTRDLALLSKAQEGALDLDMQPIDLVDVVADVCDRLRSQYDVKGVGLDADLHAGLQVNGDHDRLVQAVMNVVGNALTYTPAGGTVTIDGSRRGSECLVSVTDTGAGLRPEQLEFVFERFTRLDAGSAGTGIGLNIARTILRLHGGDLTASSPGPGEGTSFTFRVPAT